MTVPAEKAYSGVRILEAMRSGTRYGDAVFNQILKAMPAGTSSILDFGAGSGFFVEKFKAAGIKVDAVEQDAALQGGASAFGAKCVARPCRRSG